MHNLILQLQFLLTALGALLPLLPQKNRERLSDVLRLAAEALRFGDAVTQESEDLAKKLRAIRLDIETMAAQGRAVDADMIDHAFERVRAASASLRAALEAAEAKEA